jgi:K+-transporting ATPase KdpF subunit
VPWPQPAWLAIASQRVSVWLPGVQPGLSARGAQMTIIDGILLAVSVAVFIYLGIAIFKPDWF